MAPLAVLVPSLAALVASAPPGLPRAGSPPIGPVISGTGAFRYQYLPDRLVLPPTVDLLHGHGLAKDGVSLPA